MVGVHTHWCVLGEPDVSVLATARIRCVGLGATLMPLPLRGSSAWPGYTPTGVYEGGPAGVPVYQDPEEVSYTIHESMLQSSTARLLVSCGDSQPSAAHVAPVTTHAAGSGCLNCHGTGPVSLVTPR